MKRSKIIELNVNIKFEENSFIHNFYRQEKIWNQKLYSMLRKGRQK